jgi:RHS repeat-associated protein
MDASGTATSSPSATPGGSPISPTSFHHFEKYPNIDLKDPNLKMLDLNGDGMPDMLISQAQDFVWYAAKGKIGYDDYHLAARAADDERGPQILFSDKDEKMLIATADMSGDGLQDIVLITYANVCYYPNLGYGRFGAKVTLEMEGAFAAYDSFNPQYLHLADIDGSGTTDIVYAGNGMIQVWFNQSGNSLSTASSFFNPFPELDNQSRITLIDLLGTGVSCIVWSSSMPAHSHAPLRYIDLMGGQKPHILYGYKNNAGKEVTLEYRSSTQYYLTDKQQGIPWVTRLPFPVQCVSKLTTVDKVSQTRFTSEYSYHHGYYDAKEREFRGFAMVEQKDSEEYDQFVQATQSAGAQNTIEQDLYQPVVTTRTWYHTGAWLHREQVVHQLQNEYYPQALIASGQLTNKDWIAGLSDYLLDESSSLPDNLEPAAISECFRALKGLVLRQETYSDEGDADTQLIPYTVVQHNYNVQLVQPKAGQKYAVFFSHEQETLTFNYERNPLDPRIAHSINVSIDAYGNVLESASIVYGRQQADPNLPTDADRQQQTQQYIVYTQNAFTPIIDTATTYRLPITYETQTWELNAPTPANLPATPGSNPAPTSGPTSTSGSKLFYTAAAISPQFAGATIILYEQQTVLNQKRKLSHSRTLFMKNDFSGPMPFGTQDTLALPYENYLLAFTPTLGPSIYGGKFDDGLWRNKAMYVNFQGDTNYWVRSGRTYFYPDLSATPDTQTIPAPTAADLTFAQDNFYHPVAFQDNFGNLTKVFYDPYKLSLQRTVDAVNNESNVDGFNYRTLTPYLLRDANDNRTGIRLDELGRVIRTFVMGKTTETKGDPIDTSSTELSANDQPTSIIAYDFRYYATSGQLPDGVTTSLREEHYYSDPLPSQTTGGFLGWLKRLFGGGNPTITPAAQVTWQLSYGYSDGSGHMVLKKVQAEPGIAPQRNAQGQLIFDGSGNLQQADTTPDLRWVGNGRTIYNNKGKAVKQYEPYFDSSPEYNTENELAAIGVTDILYYDALGRNIRTTHPNGTFSKIEFDAWSQSTYDVNDTVLDSTWYTARINGALGEAEQEAAQKAALHANTPSIVYLDSLARVFLTVDDNKTQRSNETVLEEFYYSRIQLDIQGHPLSITDTRGNTVMSWEYGMTGNIGYQHSMDAGDRWMLADAMGKPLRLWDSRQQVFSHTYDAVHRPLNLIVNTGTGDQVFEQFQYGEGVSNDQQMNLRGKLYNHYDTAGLVTNTAYDFKGNRLASTRTLLKDYTKLPDWSTNPTLETETFSDEAAYDALNRPIQSIAADKSIFAFGYNEASFLNTLDVQIRGAATTTHFVTGIDYNARGQREQVLYANNTITQYTYDPDNYRLTRLLTTGNSASLVLQDLNYTYDPVGNITRQFDNAQKTIFYGGQQVEAQSDYIYDALYRLIEASGREHTGQIGVNAQDNWNDSWCMVSLQPNSPIQLRNYTQKYFYDGVGNIQKLQHITTGTASWTRTYQYNASNNQLINTKVGSQNYAYTYNAHGSMVTMPQLQTIDWNYREELQHANLGGGGDAYYVYGSSGQRIRKVIVKQGNKTTERIYLGVVEVYRERTGNTITLERSTLQVMDDKQRIAMIDSRTKGNDGTPAQLIRYQYGNHQGSACLELDDTARIISYEEYHPYGTTAYQATDASRQVPAKRYRYTGMERDDETGLNYHTARYYLPWLGRWSAADPIGIGDGTNMYSYTSNNPVRLKDPGGTDGNNTTTAKDDLDSHIHAMNKPKKGAKKDDKGAGYTPLTHDHVPQAPNAPTPHLDAILKPKNPPPPKPDPAITPFADPPPNAFPLVLPHYIPPPRIRLILSPSTLFANWTNGAGILDPGVANFEYNQQLSLGTAGTGLTSQLSARLGIVNYLELGVVGNLSLADPTAGAGGITVHVGPGDLSPDHYSSGLMLQGMAGRNSDPSGNPSAYGSASATYLASRGGNTVTYENDFNAGLNYQNFGSFGPGTSSVPHLLTAQFLAERTWFLDRQHAQSTFLEGLVAPTVALGTLDRSAGSPPALWGARLGVGGGISTSVDNSILTLSANPFIDLTSRGVGGGGLLTLTIGARAVFWGDHPPSFIDN